MTKDRYFSAYFRPELFLIGEWGDMRPSGVNSDMERGRSVPCKTDRHNEETSVPTKTARGTLRRFLPTIRYGRQTDELQESSEGLRQRGTARSKVIRKTACRRICHRPSSCEHNAGNANIHKSKSSCDEGPQLLPPSRKVPPLGRTGRSQPSTDTLKNSTTPTGPPLSSVTTIE